MDTDSRQSNQMEESHALRLHEGVQDCFDQPKFRREYGDVAS